MLIRCLRKSPASEVKNENKQKVSNWLSKAEKLINSWVKSLCHFSHLAKNSSAGKTDEIRCGVSFSFVLAGLLFDFTSFTYVRWKIPRLACFAGEKLVKSRFLVWPEKSFTSSELELCSRNQSQDPIGSIRFARCIFKGTVSIFASQLDANRWWAKSKLALTQAAWITRINFPSVFMLIAKRLVW